MQTWSRRRAETILLAVLAIAMVIPLRYHVESRVWFLLEMGALCALFFARELLMAFWGTSKGARLLANCATAFLALTPVVFAIAVRFYGSPIAFEISALATFGAVALSMAVGAKANRTRSLSVIISGFLVLFCASISDSRYAAVLPLIWMLGCVWHLVANHWERLDLAMPDSVQRTWSLRPGVLVVALIALSTGGYAVKDRLSSNRLAFGVMPTSGGSEWSDPAARMGVGSGDAAIAAKDHAESFGAVDSDLFLESTESSLFDMVNDTLGEAKKKRNKWERAQAMGDQNVIPMHERVAKSEQGGGSFSTERMPPKKHRHFKDSNNAGVIQWDGPTGIRLAMHRYDTFDGRDWSQASSLKNEKLTRVKIGEAAWFFDPVMRAILQRDPEAATVGLLKVIRLKSPRLPVPMMTAGVHIKEIHQQNFFAISDDGSFFMPGRERVPPLTVVHLASVNLMEDEIQSSLAIDENSEGGRQVDVGGGDVGGSEGAKAISRLVADWTSNIDQPYDKLRSIVDHLRTEFTLARDGESCATSMNEFLQSRRGGIHLFATTAALMAREIGLSSRLVTGFYVRPDAFDVGAGHASVLPEDVHVWAEVQLADGRWFEIEPSPGYEQPHYQPSWRLLTRRFAAAYWPIAVGSALALACVYISRRVWIDWLLIVVWSFARWLRPRRRVCVAIRIIEARARLAGQPRPTGTSQRAWLEQLTHGDAGIATAAQKLSDAADALCFGYGYESASRDATGVVGMLRVRTISALTREASS